LIQLGLKSQPLSAIGTIFKNRFMSNQSGDIFKDFGSLDENELNFDTAELRVKIFGYLSSIVKIQAMWRG